MSLPAPFGYTPWSNFGMRVEKMQFLWWILRTSNAGTQPAHPMNTRRHRILQCIPKLTRVQLVSWVSCLNREVRVHLFRLSRWNSLTMLLHQQLPDPHLSLSWKSDPVCGPLDVRELIWFESVLVPPWSLAWEEATALRWTLKSLKIF